MKNEDFSSLKYKNTLSNKNKARRLIWSMTSCILFRYTPNVGFNSWRIKLLKIFGAKIGTGCKVSSSVKVWAPWNLVMGQYSCLAEGVDCYCVAPVRIGNKCAVSQRAFICTGSHDVQSLTRPLLTKSIEIKNHAWICAEAFVGPGVTIGEGAVLAARGVAVKDLEPWSVYGGNPAKFIKKRVIEE